MSFVLPDRPHKA